MVVGGTVVQHGGARAGSRTLNLGIKRRLTFLARKRQDASGAGGHERPRQPMAETDPAPQRPPPLTAGRQLRARDRGLRRPTGQHSPLVSRHHDSREPLRVSGETVWRVPLLATPDAAASIDPHEQARATRAAANGLSDQPAAGVEQFARRLTARGAAGQP